MRYIVIIFLGCLIFSCAKQNSKNPLPEIEFKDFINAGKTATKGDTAVMVLGYQDGDGDLFVNNPTEGPNIIFTTYVYRSATQTFVADVFPGTSDTFRVSNSIKQPDNGYYKGKSIRGEIYWPLKEFRTNDQDKIVKFVVFMVDLKKHKSNVVTSPVYTLNF